MSIRQRILDRFNDASPAAQRSVLLLGVAGGSFEDPPAAQWMLPETPEYYYLSADQLTIPKGVHGNYDGVLNEAGQAQYADAVARADDRVETPPLIVEYCLERSNSGPWYANASSPLFRSSDIGALNTFDDRLVIGWIADTDIHRLMVMARCVLYTNDWVLVEGGAVYRLGTPMPSAYIKSMWSGTTG